MAIGAVGVLTTSPASARTPRVTTMISCGQEVTTSIVVANDLTCTSGPVLDISGTGITIDFNGHRLTGSGVVSFCTCFSTVDCALEIPAGVTVRNGRFSKLEVGMTGATLSRVELREGSFLALRGGQVDSSRFSDSRIHLLRDDSTISNNKLIRSNIRLDNVDYALRNVSIANNSIVDSPASSPGLPAVFGAISVANDLVAVDDITGEIVRNRINGSAADGIAVHSTQAMFGSFLIADNVVLNSLGNGISILSGPSPVPVTGGPITVSGNTALRNGGYGMKIASQSAAIIDGGRQRGAAQRFGPPVHRDRLPSGAGERRARLIEPIRTSELPSVGGAAPTDEGWTEPWTYRSWPTRSSAAHDRGHTGFGVYVLRHDEPGAELARSVEREVFLEFFGNTPELLAEEYGPYEQASAFICVIDHVQRRPAGVMRVILPSPRGFKSLHDLESHWGRSVDDVMERSRIDLDRNALWDVATLAVGADYRGAASGGLVSLALFQALAMLGTRSGTRWAVAILDVVVLDLIQSEFLRPFTMLDGLSPRRYLDSPSSLPVLLDAADFESRLRFRAPSMAEILFDGRGLETVISTPPWDVASESVATKEIA